DGADAVSLGVEAPHRFKERLSPLASRRALPLGTRRGLRGRSPLGWRLARPQIRRRLCVAGGGEPGRFLQRLLLPRERALQCGGQVLEEVKTVGDLQGVGRSRAGSFRAGNTAVTGTNLAERG